MPRKHFTNEHIVFALRQAEDGTIVEEVCQKMGVAEPTFHRWKKQFVGMGVPEFRLPTGRVPGYGVAKGLSSAIAG